MDLNSVDYRAIRQVIEQQLQAFQQDDAEGAFAFASPEIRARFGTAENFIHMVRSAYAAVYRPRSVVFERLGNVNGIPAQTVVLLDADGTPLKALYLMDRQCDGTWKISGCFLMPVQGAIP